MEFEEIIKYVEDHKQQYLNEEINHETIHVSKEYYNKIIEKLGYKPSNLVINKFLPESNQAFVIDSSPLEINFDSKVVEDKNKWWYCGFNSSVLFFDKDE